jgi:coenzyme PQQ precursor peptide PqqA
MEIAWVPGGFMTIIPEETDMAWETPAYNDVRFGFEVTMYINNR